MALVGSDVSFERSSELIWETTGIVISDNSIQQISESVGKELREYEKEQRGKGLLNNVGRTGVKRRIYMEADGGRVPLRESWREVKLGCCFEGEKSPEGGQRGQTRYFGGIYDNLSEFITLWRNEAMYFGVNQEGVELIILRDGAEWIGNQAFEEFPGAVQILDFYHAVEHLGEVAKIVFGEGSEEGKKWVEKFGQRLKEGRLEEVISELEGIRKKKRGAGRVIEQTIAYYQKNASQMEYDKYLEKGYFIGSGVIESGCRHLSNQRLKISGARWIKDNANDILSIRLARANKTWDSYWARFRKSA